jgi:hypothetical protein
MVYHSTLIKAMQPIIRNPMARRMGTDWEKKLSYPGTSSRIVINTVLLRKSQRTARVEHKPKM